jgi:hypothetical protein
MAFGLTNAPATFQRFERCLYDLSMKECSLYLDDIIVFSSNIEEHFDRVFERLNSFGLKLNPAKCNLFQNSVRYLGHVISEDGIRTDPDKVQPLHD